MITCHRCGSTSVDRLTSTASTGTYRCDSCTTAWTQQRFATLPSEQSHGNADQQFLDWIRTHPAPDRDGRNQGNPEDS